ncbi:MAG TPA: FGGY family carbohydrate kinase [Acetobacteraceae bacterium]|nr:FGGY family carbohydrate kinase [Acetobacteraceae bacterium]
MPAGPLLVGIDLGTSRIRAVLLNSAGQALREAAEPTPVQSPHPGLAEHDPEALWQTAAAVLRQLTAGLPDPSAIRGVAAASFGESAVLLDESGNPVAPAIAWYDERTRPQMEDLDRRMGGAALFATSGLRLDPTLGLCKLLWMQRHWAPAMRRAARWLNVADWIAFRLSGVAATDCSLASRTLALDLQGKAWNTALLERCGIPPTLPVPLRPSGTALGPVTPRAAEQTGLPPTAIVGVGAHDHVCGALASGVTEPDIVLDSLGTAEALFRTLDRPILAPAAGTRGYWQGLVRVAPGLDLHYILGALPTSGAAVEWFRRTCADGAPHTELIEEAAGLPPGSRGVCFLPHLRLSTAPEPDPAARGAFIGLSADTERAALYRAVLEGLAFESRLVLEGMESLPGLGPPHAIRVIGGGSRNDLFLRIKAAVLGRPLTRMPAAEGTALGAALLGGIAAGVYPDMEHALAATTAPGQTIPPDPALRAAYDDLYETVYRCLHATLRPLHAALDGLARRSLPALEPEPT